MIRASARRPADGARRAVGTPGRALDPAVRQRLGAAYGFDFASVRVHTDVAAARSAAELGAVAYTLGRDVVFGQNRYAPGTAAGDRLIAHELAHVVQQDGAPASLLSVGPATSDAERAAEDATAGRTPPRRAVAGGAIQRQVELRDVGRGEQSGIARLPELLGRLNSVSTGLTFALSGRTLACPAPGRRDSLRVRPADDRLHRLSGGAAAAPQQPAGARQPGGGLHRPGGR